MENTHPLLRPPRQFGQKKLDDAYGFSLHVEGLRKGPGLSQLAHEYEAELRGSVRSSIQSVLRESAEVDPYIMRVHDTAKSRLDTAIPDQQFQPHSGQSKRMKVMDSFDRVLRIMGMTCKVVLELPEVKRELKILVARQQGKKESTLGGLIPESDDLPMLRGIASFEDSVGRQIFKSRTLLAVAHKLGLDVGDRLRGHYEFD